MKSVLPDNRFVPTLCPRASMHPLGASRMTGDSHDTMGAEPGSSLPENGAVLAFRRTS